MMSSVLVLSMFWQQFGIGCQCNVKGSLVHLQQQQSLTCVIKLLISISLSCKHQVILGKTFFGRKHVLGLCAVSVRFCAANIFCMA